MGKASPRAGRRRGLGQAASRGQPAGQCDPPRLVVAPIQALLQPVSKREVLLRMTRRSPWAMCSSLEELTGWMLERGMSRAEVVEVPGEFSVRGGILDVFPTDSADPVRIEFFGDEIESIRPFDPGRSARSIAGTTSR